VAVLIYSRPFPYHNTFSYAETAGSSGLAVSISKKGAAASERTILLCGGPFLLYL